MRDRVGVKLVQWASSGWVNVPEIVGEVERVETEDSFERFGLLDQMSDGSPDGDFFDGIEGGDVPSLLGSGQDGDEES